MKTKVLVYANNGNDVVAKNVELEKIDEHVYLYRVDEMYKVIGEIEGIYFHVDNCHNLDRLNKEGVKDFVDNFVKYVSEEEVFVSNLYIAVFRALGKTDYLPALMEKRERWLKRIREEEEERERKIKEEHERYLQKEQELFEEKYNENVKEYILGNPIKPEMFLEMLSRNNIYVHPRTKHTIANNLSAICARGIWNKDGKKGNTEKVFEAIYELNDKL